MSDFVSRPEYFKQLTSELCKVKPQTGRFLSMRGRRRVGKSRLVEEWLEAEGIRSVFFTASHRGITGELELFEESIRQSSLELTNQMEGLSFSTWEAALGFIADNANPTSPSVIVIDEFPYLVEDSPKFPALIQKIWDTKLRKSPVLLLFVGSDIAMMEQLTLYGNPLYDRPTREMIIQPFSPPEMASLLGLSGASALDAYLVVGGFPRFAQLWLPGMNRKDFLLQELSDSSSPLIVSGERILASEFPTNTHARNVLSAIGSGETTFTKILHKTGLSEVTLKRSLKVLTEKKHIVIVANPYSVPLSREPRYQTADPYLRFWLRFLAPALEEIERGRGPLVVEKIENSWTGWAGKAIEPIVQEAVTRMLPNPIYGGAKYAGGFWTRNNQVEVDLVGIDDITKPKNVAFVGSIKWYESKLFNRKDLQVLIAHKFKVPGTDENTLLVGVSRNGFEVEGLDFKLTPKELLKAWEK